MAVFVINQDHTFFNEISLSSSNASILCFTHRRIDVEVSFMFMVLCDDVRFSSL